MFGAKKMIQLISCVFSAYIFKKSQEIIELLLTHLPKIERFNTLIRSLDFFTTRRSKQSQHHNSNQKIIIIIIIWRKRNTESDGGQWFVTWWWWELYGGDVVWDRALVTVLDLTVVKIHMVPRLVQFMKQQKSEKVCSNGLDWNKNRWHIYLVALTRKSN